MDDYVEVGIYANSPEGDLGDLYLEKHKLRSGEQTIKLAVSKEPDLAGIDLLRFLIEFFHVTFLRKAFSSWGIIF